MKKLISLILCVVVILTFAVPAFAADAAYNFAEDASMKYTIPTKYDSVLRSQTGEYAMICGDVIQPVGRMNLELSDESAVNLFLGTDDIPKEVKEYVEELVKRNELDENNNLTVTYFSPLLLDGNSYTNTGSYNGMSMRTDGIYIENMPTGFFFSVNGSKAKERAAAIDRITFSIAGMICEKLGFGQSLLEIYENATGQTVVAAASSDFTQVQLMYDNYRQWTYGLYGGTDWQLGYASEKVIIRDVEFYQNFTVNGKPRQQNVHMPGKTVKSTHFDDPWATAYYSILSPLDEWISCEIGGITWTFASWE